MGGEESVDQPFDEDGVDGLAGHQVGEDEGSAELGDGDAAALSIAESSPGGAALAEAARAAFIAGMHQAILLLLVIVAVGALGFTLLAPGPGAITRSAAVTSLPHRDDWSP